MLCNIFYGIFRGFSEKSIVKSLMIFSQNRSYSSFNDLILYSTPPSIKILRAEDYGAIFGRASGSEHLPNNLFFGRVRYIRVYPCQMIPALITIFRTYFKRADRRVQHFGAVKRTLVDEPRCYPLFENFQPHVQQ